MAAHQLAGRRPLYFTADVSILLLTFIFVAKSQRSLGSGQIVTKLCHMFGGDCDFLKLGQKFGVPPPPKKLAAQKLQNFGEISDFMI